MLVNRQIKLREKMSEIVELLREFADKYHSCGYNPSAFSDDDLDKYIDAMDILTTTVSIVYNKLKDERYQRRIDAAHDGE